MPSDLSTVHSDQSMDELRRELAEAREREVATAEILRVISRSPMDLQLVFEQVAASAVRLCDAHDAVIFQVDGEMLRLVAHHGQIPIPEPIGQVMVPLTRALTFARAILDRKTIHIADLQAETTEYPEGSEFARSLGLHTTLAVPLVVSGKAVAVISIRRADVREFNDRQIALLKTFADQAVIAIENTRLFEAEQAGKRELQESLEYQTATSDVLEVISRTPIDLQPVLAAICETVARLCETKDAEIFIREGDRLRLGWVQGPIGTEAENWPITRGLVMGRAVLDRELIHVHDLRVAEEEYPQGYQSSLLVGHRTIIAVPLMRKGEAVGVLRLRRLEVKPFTDKQIALLRTFADQAVIAIENTRLFEEVQTRTRELQQSLEYQTATSEVLEVISRSPTQLQPVLRSIAQTAARLCDSFDAQVYRFVDGRLQMVAQYGSLPRLPVAYQLPLTRGSVTGRAILDRKTVHVEDIAALLDGEFPDAKPSQLVVGHRTTAATPLIREGEALGAILLRRTEVRPFSLRQLSLLRTFADQAVIAIENTRLFEAEQTRSKEFAEALEQQTATADVLKVISNSPGQLEPVFESMLANAVRICGAKFGVLYRHNDGMFQAVAWHGVPSAYAEHLQERGSFRPVEGGALHRLLRTKDVIRSVDRMVQPRPGPAAEYGGARSLVAVPMFKESELVGAIIIYRQEVEPFTDKQIELVKNFASQAVIAIENARLLNELRESLQQQTATADVLKVISRATFDLPRILDTLVESAATLCDSYDTAILQKDGDVLQIVSHRGHIPSIGRAGTVPLTRGAAVWCAVLDRQTIHLADVQSETNEYPESSAIARRLGYHSMLAVPLVGAGEAIGAITLRRSEVRPFTDRQIELLQTFADQAVIAIENARLFEEVQARTRELAKTVDDLEIASQHKSQFVANMSHELRTPLAAILGYAELMQEGFYEPQGPKSLAALTRVRSNGKHLLGLINTVLDIAKVESGQFKLNLGEYALENVVETVRSATESLAENKKLALQTEITKGLPLGLGDEQRLTQVLLNLVGNAIKFTDVGEVRIAAKTADGHFAITVADTGPGIPEEHQARIFEQFHQVDSSNTKAKGGTGLGLAITKQIVEMHGGRIWVESTLGRGAIFQLVLPIRAAAHDLNP